MLLYQKQVVFAQNVAKLLQFIHQNGNLVTLGEAYRTPEQAQIYANEGKGIVDSLHCKRLAVDLNLFSLAGDYLTDTQPYKKYGEYWKSLDPHNGWGGDFPNRKDANHFELRDE